MSYTGSAGGCYITLLGGETSPGRVWMAGCEIFLDNRAVNLRHRTGPAVGALVDNSHGIRWLHKDAQLTA
jgi:hypothetical protein